MPYNPMKFQLKKKFVLERLIEKGITHSQQGTPIHECDYEELKYELVLSAYREIDIEKDENKWF